MAGLVAVPLDHGACIDYDVAGLVNGDWEQVQRARRRAADKVPGERKLRAVAVAAEATRWIQMGMGVGLPGNHAAQVRALPVDRQQPVVRVMHQVKLPGVYLGN